MIDLNKDVPTTPFQDMLLKSMAMQKELKDIYISMINVIRDRNFVKKDQRSKAATYDNISLKIGSRLTIKHAVIAANKNGNVDPLRRIVTKLIEAKL